MYDQNPRTVPPPQADDVDDFLSRYTKRRVREEAQKQGVDPDLLERQFQQESAYKPDVIRGQRRSSAGAIGTAQLMPGTAKDLKVDPYNIDQNIEGGARYMKQQLDTFGGDRRKALAAYNAGPGAVRKYGGVPSYRETQDYVNRIEGRGQRQQPQDDVDEFLSRYKEPQPQPQPRTPSTTTPNVFNKNVERDRRQATQEAQKALNFRNVNPMAEAQRLTGRVMSNPGAEQRRKIADQYNQKSWLGQRGEDLRQDWESFKTGAADTVLGAADVVGSAAGGDFRPLKEAVRGIGLAASNVPVSKYNPFAQNWSEAERAKVTAENEQAMQQLAQERNTRQANDPLFRRIQRERQEQQLAREAAPSLTSRVTRGIGDAVLNLPAMVGAAELGGIPAVTALTAAQQDFARDPKGAALNTVGAGLPIVAGKAISPLAARAAGRVAPALQRPVQLGIEGAAGGAANVAQYAGTQAALGREIDPQEAVSLGITGTVLSGAMAPKLADVQRQNALRRIEREAQAWQPKEAQPPTTPADAQTPQTLPPTEPISAQTAPDAQVTTKLPRQVAGSYPKPERTDPMFVQGVVGDRAYQQAVARWEQNEARVAKIAEREAARPKPLPVQDVRAQIDGLKQAPNVQALPAQQVAEPLVNELHNMQQISQAPTRDLSATENLADIGKMGGGIIDDIYDMLWEKAQRGDVNEGGHLSPLLQAARMIRSRGGLQSRDEMVALSKEYTQIRANTLDKGDRAGFQRQMGELVNRAVPQPTRGLSAPLPASEAKPPQSVQEITRTTAEIPNQRPPVSPIPEASAPLPPFPKLTPPTNRITEGAGNELPRRVSQPLEGQPTPANAAAARLAKLRAAAQQAPPMELAQPERPAPMDSAQPESHLDRLKRIAQRVNQQFAPAEAPTVTEAAPQPKPEAAPAPKRRQAAPTGEPKLSNRTIKQSLQEEMGATSTNRSDKLRLSGPSENYREVVTRWDDAPEGTVFRKPEHYGDETNVLFDRRLEDRKTTEGDNALFFMEAQSDWHQAKDAPPAPMKNTWLRRALDDTVAEASQAGQDGVLLPKTVEQLYEIQRWGAVRQKDGRYVNSEGFDITPVVRRYLRELPDLAKKAANKAGVKLETRTVDDGKGGKQELWFLPVKKQAKAAPRELSEQSAIREREALPPVERRRAQREAALKGQFGKLSEASRAGATENRSLVGNAQLRRLLGLAEMPAYRLPDAEINPKTGEPYVNPEWNEAAQDTLNAMAALAGKERSSQINFGAGDAGSRGEMGDLFLAVRKLAQQKGEALEPALREAFKETVGRARTAQSGYQEFQVDERTGNIRNSLYELTRRGELTRDEIRAHQTAWREVAAEFGISRNQADELFKGMRAEARTRAERAERANRLARIEAQVAAELEEWWNQLNSELPEPTAADNVLRFRK